MSDTNDLINLFPEDDAVPDDFRHGPVTEQRDYLVNGEIRQWPGALLPVVSPVCLRQGTHVEPVLLGHTPRLDSRTAMQALDAAVAAYDNGRGAWPQMSLSRRIDRLEHLLAFMREQQASLVCGLMWEVGKRLEDARSEFDRTCQYIADTIAELRRPNQRDDTVAAEKGTLAHVRRRPVGVVLCMNPYNYPLYETFTTLISALAMGNSVVFKPSRFGVLLLRPFLAAFQRLFPAGAINVIYGKGRETVGALLASGKVDLFAFVGTYRGAMSLSRLHPHPHRLRHVFGLDAKNPGIVLPDADLDNAVRECLAGTLLFNGQRCTALKLLFVHESVVNDFLEQFCRGVDAMKAGMPWESGVTLTPIPEPGKIGYLNELVADAKAKGASVINRGGGDHGASLFRPAVLYPVNPLMRVYQEEQFGPVIPVVPYADIDDVIEYVTDADFGQQMSIFGRDPVAVGHLVDHCLSQVGRINLNVQCQRGPDTLPFKGRKDSAEGTLSVSDALRVYSTRTLVATRLDEGNRKLVGDVVRNDQAGSPDVTSIL